MSDDNGFEGYKFDNYKSGYDDRVYLPKPKKYRRPFDFDRLITNTLGTILGLALLGLIILAGVGIYQAFNPGPTITLRKAEWSCSQSYRYTTTTFILVGKVGVPSIQHHTKCTQYNLKE